MPMSWAESRLCVFRGMILSESLWYSAILKETAEAEAAAAAVAADIIPPAAEPATAAEATDIEITHGSQILRGKFTGIKPVTQQSCGVRQTAWLITCGNKKSAYTI